MPQLESPRFDKQQKNLPKNLSELKIDTKFETCKKNTINYTKNLTTRIDEEDSPGTITISNFKIMKTDDKRYMKTDDQSSGKKIGYLNMYEKSLQNKLKS